MATADEDPLQRRRDELRRIVYGAPGEPADGFVVELTALERELAERAGVGGDGGGNDGAGGNGAGPRAEGFDGLADAATATDAAASATGPHWPAGRRVLIAAIALFVLVVGGVSLVGPERELLSPPIGLGVFERAPTANEMARADQVATAAELPPNEAATLRPVGRAFGYEFWVHRDDERVCLLSQREFWFPWVDECVTIERFRASGLERRITGDDIRYGIRPRGMRPSDVIVVSWGARSAEVEWRVEPAS